MVTDDRERRIDLRQPCIAADCSPPVSRVDAMAAVGLYEYYVVGHAAVTFHSRGTARHPSYCQPARLGALREQAFDLASRHMAFDCITVDDRGVAAAERIGDAVAGPVAFRVPHVLGLHTEAVGAQMLDPRAAAASGGFLVDDHRLRGVRAAVRQQGCSQKQQDKFPSLHAVHSFEIGADRSKIGSDRSPAGSPAAASIHASVRVRFQAVRILAAGNPARLIHIKR